MSVNDRLRAAGCGLCDETRNVQYVSRFVLLIVILVAFSSCTPAYPLPPTPRIIFPTDSRPTPTQAPTPPPTPSPTPRPTPVADPLTEYRALWVDGLNDDLKSPEQITRLIHDCQSISCNVLLVQMRIHANVLYLRSSEPRVDGIAPDFDPLTDVISKAHSVKPPIQVYAWMNMFPVWPTNTDPPTSPQHLLNTHGLQAAGADNWLALNEQGNTSGSGLYYLDPGNPDAAAFVASQVVGVVKNYSVDGVHLDFIRYGGIQWGYNPASVARFDARFNRKDTPAPDDPQWSQWRRDQMTAVVRRIWLESTAANPLVQVSAALIPWGDGPADDAAWKQTSAYNAVFQDWRAWLEEGILDIGFPMNYFSDSSAPSSFDHWIEFEKDHHYNRHLVIGIGSYLNSLEESLAQIRRARGRSAAGAHADGVAIYVHNQTDKDHLPFSQFVEATTLGLTPSPAMPVFAPIAYLPPMPWKSTPTTGHLMGLVTVAGKPADGETVTLAGSIRRTTITDGSGFYGFVDLSPGAYRATVGNTTRPVTIRAGNVATVNFER